jgi:oligopeptidase A
VEFALFDMLLHETAANPTNHQGGHALQVLQTVRDEVAVLPAPAYSRTPNTFSHIFSGGYAAGYYSYKWAELLSADAYAAFEEDTADNTPNSATNSGKNNATGQPASQLGSPSANMAAGQRYRQEILEVGGSRSAMESFVAFRGREPRIDALLRHQGMA